MGLPLFNEAEDDTPETEQEIGFVGLNTSLKPTLLASGMLQSGENTLLDVDGLLDTRPGLRLISDVFATSGNSVDGMGYYDVPGAPGKEAILLTSNTQLYVITGTTAPQTPTPIGAPAHTAGKKIFQQLVDKMFYTTPTDLRWVQWNGATWNNGAVTQFSDGSTLPPFATMVAHKFRLFGAAAESDELWVSKFLQASASGGGGDWIKTSGVRVGIGGGDPLIALLSGQDSNLIALNNGSCWMIDTSDLNPANWPIRKITDKVGCVARDTALNVGQDIFFLSRLGVVSLGSLADTLSISAATTISAPLQATIDSINWLAVGVAKAVMWKHYYLLAVPVDGSTWANRVLCYNTTTRQWVGEWTSKNPQFTNSPGGWGEALMTKFGGQDETVWADIDGGVFKVDRDYESDDATGGGRYEIETIARLRGWVFGSQVSQKEPFWFEVEFYKSSAQGVYAMLVCDDEKTYPEVALNTVDTLLTDIKGSNNPVIPHFVPLRLSTNYVARFPAHWRGKKTFREVAVQIVSSKGRLAVREVKFAAFIGTVKLI